MSTLCTSQEPPDVAEPDGEIEALACGLKAVDTDQRPVVSEEWSAGVARIDRSLSLDDICDVLSMVLGTPLVCVTNLRNDTHRIGPCFAGWMPDCVHIGPYFNGCRIAQGDGHHSRRC